MGSVFATGRTLNHGDETDAPTRLQRIRRGPVRIETNTCGRFSGNGAIRFVFLAIALLVFSPGWAEPQNAEAPALSCVLQIRAMLDITTDDTGRITVPVTINGVQKELMVDTGAAQSALTARATNDLNLKPRPAWPRPVMQGFGGRHLKNVVEIAELGLGQMKGRNFTFFVDDLDMETAGVLGGDFLYYFDVDLDFSRAKLNLISPEHCPGEAVYWTNQPHGEIPFKIEDNLIVLKVQLDGQDVSAVLDTGAADTVMSLEKASGAFGLDKAALAKSRHYPFKTLTFGDVGVNAPAIQLVPDDESAIMGHYGSSLHMVVGMTVLRRLHLYISYKEKKIYVTPATQY